TTDTVRSTLEVPCPGIDSSGLDANGDLWFAPWMWVAPGHVLIDGPATCIAKIPAGSDALAPATIPFASLTDGKEGAALHALSGSRLVFSTLYPERAPSAASTNELSSGPNWKLWWHDGTSGDSQPIDSIPWNSGAYYLFDVDQRPIALISAA